jgi:hypothetical protein
MKTRIVIIFLILTVSCQKNKKLYEPKEGDVLVTMNSISDYDSITKQVKYKGNVDAYDELFYYLMDSDKIARTDTLMYYSKIMAEKYNNEVAYYYYFTALCEKYDIPFEDTDYSSINISLMDDSIKKQVKNWLNEMVEKKIITQEQYESVKK